MDKHYSVTLALALSLGVVSCSKMPEIQTGSFDIHAGMSSEEVIPELNPVFDKSGRITALTDNAGGSVLSSNSPSGLSSGSDFHFENVKGGAKPRYVVRGGNPTMSCGLISSGIPRIQNISGSAPVAPDAPVLVGAVSENDGGYSSVLKNLSGYVGFTVRNGGFEKFTLSSVERIDLAGTVNIPVSSVAEGAPSFLVAKGSGSIEVTVPGKGSFYIAVLPGKSFTPVLTFTDASGNVSIDTIAAVTPSRAAVTDLGVIDTDLHFTPPIPPDELTEWEKQVRARADLLYNIAWTPSSKVSTSHQNEYFPVGVSQRGMPYSSVWGCKPAGFVGYTVSFYTFLSALNNAKGLIYDIDFHNLDAAGKAGSMYGSVCSTTVMYILGYPYGYQTSHIVADYVPALTDLGDDFSDWKICDAFCYNDGDNGHTLMIYDIDRDADGAIRTITVEEAWMPLTRRVTYTPASLKKRLQKDGYSHFRVDQDKFCYVQPSFIEQSYDFNYSFPEEICLSEGDRKTFVSSDTTVVSVDILTDSYPEIVLEKDGVVVATRQYSGKSREDYVNLPAGQYRLYLRDGDRVSAPTVFEMAGTLSLSASIISDEIRVSIPSGYTPICIVPVSSGNRPLLSVGKAKDGRWAFPIPEGVDTSEWGTTLTVRLAGRYSTFTYPSKIRYK